MNLSTAVFLINDNARAIVATYEATENAPRTMFKSFDPSIKVDDYVVVPTDTRHRMTVCKVVEVDVEVDFDSPTQIAWIIGRIDLADVTQIKEQEAAAIAAIQAAEKLKKRKALQDSMNALLAETGGDLKLLSIAPASEAKALEDAKVA